MLFMQGWIVILYYCKKTKYRNGLNAVPDITKYIFSALA